MPVVCLSEKRPYLRGGGLLRTGGFSLQVRKNEKPVCFFASCSMGIGPPQRHTVFLKSNSFIIEVYT